MPYDKVIVHASLRSVGPVENGADGLIDAMCSYLDKGLLIIPTHTWDLDGNIIEFPPFHTHYTAASDRCVSEYYPNYKKAFEYTGAVKYAKLGNALVYVCDARGMTDTVRKLWENADHDLCIREEIITVPLVP